jgi:hypothetical protein
MNSFGLRFLVLVSWLGGGGQGEHTSSGARVYINPHTRMLQATASERGLQHHHIISYMMTRGSESENGLFAATVTTGAMAAVAAAFFGLHARCGGAAPTTKR